MKTVFSFHHFINLYHHITLIYHIFIIFYHRYQLNFNKIFNFKDFIKDRKCSKIYFNFMTLKRKRQNIIKIKVSKNQSSQNLFVWYSHFFFPFFCDFKFIKLLDFDLTRLYNTPSSKKLCDLLSCLLPGTSRYK